MRFTKKKLLSIIKENLNEMPMTFDGDDRPDQGVQNQLQRGDTPLKKIPFPQTGDEPNQNFQELLASERYKQVVQKVRQYAGVRGPMKGMDGMMPLIGTMAQAHNAIVATERRFRPQLEALAIELIRKEFDLTEDDIEFDAKIVGMGEIDTSDFKREEGNEENEDEVDIEIETELFDELATLNLEKAKRRFINSMIQGASKRGHYMYHLVADRIADITGSDSLVSQYGVLMSINDTMYWQVSDETMKQAMNGGGGASGVGGKESIDVHSNPPKVIAQGVNFPVLVHELIKGTMEVIAAMRGQADDVETTEKVRDSEDTLEKEAWDLRLGPAIWDRIRAAFPEHILTDEDKRHIQLILFQHIVEKPAKEFLTMMKEVVSGSDRGKRLLATLVEIIEAELSDYDASEIMARFDDDLEMLADDTDNEELGDFLGSLGIRWSDDDE
jgi:hypothetical protein